MTANETDKLEANDIEIYTKNKDDHKRCQIKNFTYNKLFLEKVTPKCLFHINRRSNKNSFKFIAKTS